MTPSELYLVWTAVAVLCVYVFSTLFTLWKDAIEMDYRSRYPGYVAITLVVLFSLGLLTFNHSTYEPTKSSLTTNQTVRTDFVEQVEEDNKSVMPQTKKQLEEERIRRYLEEEDASVRGEHVQDKATQKSINDFRSEMMKSRQEQ